MSEPEMKDEPETKEFTDELFDEALDREQAGVRASVRAVLFLAWLPMLPACIDSLLGRAGNWSCHR